MTNPVSAEADDCRTIFWTIIYRNSVIGHIKRPNYLTRGLTDWLHKQTSYFQVTPASYLAVERLMVDSLRKVFSETNLDTLVAKLLFLLVALFSLYNAVTIGVWWQSLLFFMLVLVCGLLISGGYEDIKFTVMKLVGMEVSNSQESRTAKEVQDLLGDSDASDLEEVDVNETEGRYQLRFDRE